MSNESNRKSESVADFIKRMMPMMKKYAYEHAGSLRDKRCDVDPEDLVQMACAKLVKLTPEQRANISHEYGYIRKVVENCFNDLCPKKKNNPIVAVDVYTENFEQFVPDMRPLTNREKEHMREMEEKIASLLSQMPALKRAIGKMYFIEGETQTKIARSLHKSQSTVAGHIEDVRRHLRRELKREFADEIREIFDEESDIGGSSPDADGGVGGRSAGNRLLISPSRRKREKNVKRSFRLVKA